MSWLYEAGNWEQIPWEQGGGQVVEAGNTNPWGLPDEFSLPIVNFALSTRLATSYSHDREEYYLPTSKDQETTPFERFVYVCGTALAMPDGRIS